jgi:hypothetical protein
MRGWTGVKTLLKRRRRSVIALASALGHLILFALIGLQVSELRLTAQPPGPALDIRMIPPERPLPRPAAQTPRAAEIRPRPTRTPPPATVPTLPLSPGPPAAPGGNRGGIGVRDAPAPLPEAPGGDLRKALRGFSPGCRMRDTVGLTRAERDACDEKLGRGAGDAPYIPAPMDPAKRAAFDAQAAKDEAYRKYKQGNVPPGIDPKAAPGSGPVGLGDDFPGLKK